jgi:NAD(P)-dependent dehydrogenase (short-subunit alcohol dehydrogenase family)
VTAAAPPVAVITGAGSGIGRDIAAAMLAAGHRVALAGRNEAALQATAGRAGSGEALVVATDVRSAASVEALFAAVVARWGRIDVLVNNAGTFGTGAPLDRMPLEQWNAVIDTNLTGSFLCAQAAFRQMKGQDPQGGRIINNGSVSAHVPRPFAVAYTASKHAITGLTKAISLEGRPYQIACGQIDVGNAATEMTGAFGTGVPQADGSIRAEPLMDTRHVTEAVLLMAGLPLDANVEFMTIMATNMPYIGRGLTGPRARAGPGSGRPAPYAWRRPLRAPARSSRLHRPVMAAPAGHTRGTTLTAPRARLAEKDPEFTEMCPCRPGPARRRVPGPGPGARRAGRSDGQGFLFRLGGPGRGVHRGPHHQGQHCGRGQRAADTLHRACRQQQAGRGGQAAGQRGQREQADPDEEHPPPAKDVTSPAAEQQQAAEGQGVTVQDPGQAGRAEVQAMLDFRQRDVHHRGVQDDHQLRAQQDGQGDAAVAVAAARRAAARRAAASGRPGRGNGGRRHSASTLGGQFTPALRPQPDPLARR